MLCCRPSQRCATLPLLLSSLPVGTNQSTNAKCSANRAGAVGAFRHQAPSLWMLPRTRELVGLVLPAAVGSFQLIERVAGVDHTTVAQRRSRNRYARRPHKRLHLQAAPSRLLPAILRQRSHGLMDSTHTCTHKTMRARARADRCFCASVLGMCVPSGPRAPSTFSSASPPGEQGGGEMSRGRVSPAGPPDPPPTSSDGECAESSDGESVRSARAALAGLDGRAQPAGDGRLRAAGIAPAQDQAVGCRDVCAGTGGHGRADTNACAYTPARAEGARVPATRAARMVAAAPAPKA